MYDVYSVFDNLLIFAVSTVQIHLFIGSINMLIRLSQYKLIGTLSRND